MQVLKRLRDQNVHGVCKDLTMWSCLAFAMTEAIGSRVAMLIGLGDKVAFSNKPMLFSPISHVFSVGTYVLVYPPIF